MASTRSSVASSHPATPLPLSSSCGFHDLPDDAVTTIFRPFSLTERCRLAQVCRCFRRLAPSPELVGGSLEVSIVSKRWVGKRMASLRTWLERYAAAPRLRQLTLTLRQAVDMRAPPADHEEPQARQAQAELLAGLQAAFGGALKAPGAALRLQVKLAQPVYVDASWMPALRGVSNLELGGDIRSVAAPLHQLTGLQRLLLRFNGSLVIDSLRPSHAPLSLPASLTSLALEKHEGYGLPKAVGQLTALAELKLRNTGYGREAYGCLTGLTALRRLSLVNCSSMPDCLHKLTWLEGLHWHGGFGCDSAEEGLQELEFMLGPLRQLTYLCFHDTSHHAYWNWEEEEHWEGIPEALAGMSRLHTLIWLLPLSTAQLPRGPGSDAAWLRGLRRLALPLDVAARSLEQLRQAGALESLGICVCLCGSEEDEGEAMHEYPWDSFPEVLQLAGQLPSLRRLSYPAMPADAHAYGNPLVSDFELSAAKGAALRARPAVRIDDKADALVGQLQQGYA